MLWSSAQSCIHCVTTAGSDIAVLYLDFGVILNTIPPCTDSLVSEHQPKLSLCLLFFQGCCISSTNSLWMCSSELRPLWNTLSFLFSFLTSFLPLSLRKQEEDKIGEWHSMHMKLGLLFRCYANKLWMWSRANINCKEWNNAPIFVSYFSGIYAWPHTAVSDFYWLVWTGTRASIVDLFCVLTR